MKNKRKEMVQSVCGDAGASTSFLRRGFTLVEVMMVTLLAFLVFSAMATAMSHAFRLWNDAYARWRLAEVARRTRVIYLDGVRNIAEFKGTGMLSADREIGMIYSGTNDGGWVFSSALGYHYPALNALNESNVIQQIKLGGGFMEGSGTVENITFNTEALGAPYYSLMQLEIGSNGYYEGTIEYQHYTNEVLKTMWFADFSMKTDDMPTNLYVRRFNPRADIDLIEGDWGSKSYFLSLSYELVFFSGGREYVHPEQIFTRFVNVHY